MTLKAHFDGKHFVLDEPLPPGLVPNTPVTIVFQNGERETPTPKQGLFDELASLAIDGSDLPPDFAKNHEHYVKGAPKR